MLRRSKHRPDYFARLLMFCDALGCSVEQFPTELRRMYEKEAMSCYEIAELLSKTQAVSARSILRWINYLGIKKRSGPDAFRLAASRGRIEWHKKDPALTSRRKRIGGHAGAKIRFAVLERDGFKCVLCGSTAKEAPLEVDHTIAIVDGGTNETGNLRTLCEMCNVGKQMHKNER